jgi:hypothetical protein
MKTASRKKSIVKSKSDNNHISLTPKKFFKSNHKFTFGHLIYGICFKKKCKRHLSLKIDFYPDSWLSGKPVGGA